MLRPWNPQSTPICVQNANSKKDDKKRKEALACKDIRPPEERLGQAVRSLNLGMKVTQRRRLSREEDEKEEVVVIRAST